VPGSGHSDEAMRSMLALSDVMCTGHHAAVSGGVKDGSVVAVVGDGAVGLSAVLAARRLGAERIIAMSRHQSRQGLALEYGATDIVTERGDDGVARIKDLTNGLGAHSVIVAVGTQESMMQAIRSTRPGGRTSASSASPTACRCPVRSCSSPTSTCTAAQPRSAASCRT